MVPKKFQRKNPKFIPRKIPKKSNRQNFRKPFHFQKKQNLSKMKSKKEGLKKEQTLKNSPPLCPKKWGGGFWGETKNKIFFKNKKPLFSKGGFIINKNQAAPKKNHQKIPPFQFSRGFFFFFFILRMKWEKTTFSP